jgi:hypothetical protein
LVRHAFRGPVFFHSFKDINNIDTIFYFQRSNIRKAAGKISFKSDCDTFSYFRVDDTGQSLADEKQMAGIGYV